MNNKSNIFERILRYSNHKGFKNINEFSRFMGFEYPEKLYRLKRNENNKPSYELLEKLANTFEDLNLNWLIRGTGAMELSNQEDETVSIKETTRTVTGSLQDLVITLSDEIHKPLREGLEELKSELRAFYQIEKEKNDKIDFMYDIINKVQLFKDIQKAFEKIKD